MSRKKGKSGQGDERRDGGVSRPGTMHEYFARLPPLFLLPPDVGRRIDVVVVCPDEGTATRQTHVRTGEEEVVGQMMRRQE